MRRERFINWDANATYGALRRGHEGNHAYGDDWLNPSSLHSGGQRARAMMENVRAKILARVNASSSGQLVFTSGATETNNLVLWSWALRHKFKCSILVPATEHASILEPTKMLAGFGVDVEVLHPANGGLIDAEFFLDALLKRRSSSSIRYPVLMACMLANNETGQIYPITEIVRQVRAFDAGIWFHADCVQAFNKLELDFQELGVNSISFSGHKLGALPGVGGIVYRKGDELLCLNAGGAQEGRVRAGTENWMAIASLEEATEKKNWSQSAFAKQKLKNILSDAVPDVRYHFERDIAESASSSAVLSNTLSITIPGMIADDLVVSADLHGLMISAGAACASGKPEPSHVLLAAGLNEREALGTIRVSFRADVTEDEVKDGAEILVNCIRRMRL